jgi:hypothetical protein
MLKGTVASVPNPWNDDAERQANTILIATAPKLYAALDGLLHALHPANQRIAAQTAREVLQKREARQPALKIVEAAPAAPVEPLERKLKRLLREE